MEPESEPPGAGATWSSLNLPGAGADPIWSEPEPTFRCVLEVCVCGLVWADVEIFC